MPTKSNKERYSELYKKVTEHKKDLGSELDSEIQKETLDIFLGTVSQKIKKIREEDIPLEMKNKAIDKILDRAENLWAKKIKLKKSIKKELIKENYKGFIEKLNLYFDQGINEIEEEVLKDIGKSITDEFPFDGEFEMPNDFNDLIEQYNDAIRDLKLKLNTTIDKKKRKKYKNAIDILEGHKKQLKAFKEQQNTIDTDILEQKYNEAVEKVINSEGYGPITVNLFGIEKTFNNKAEALSALKEAKKQLYEEFKSGFRTTWEILKAIYTQPLALSKTLILGEYDEDTGEHSTFDTVGLATKGVLDMSKIFNGEVHYFILGIAEEGLALGLGIVGVSLLATFYGLHRGVFESMYRRGLKDPISKMVASMQYEDYGKKGINTNPVGDPSAPGYKDFFEYQQREGLMEMFREKLKANYTPGTPEYDAYKKKIDVLESYKLNKTKTFYSLAYKVSRDMPLGLQGNLDFNTLLFNARRTFLDGSKLYGYNPFKKGNDGKWIRIKDKNGNIRPKLGGFHVVEIDRHQALYSDTEKLLSEMNEDLQKGLDIFYKDKEVKTKNIDGRFSIVVEGGDTKTDEYKNIINYINSKKISEDEKQKLIKKFDDYIDKLGKRAKSKSNIYKDIFLLLEKDFEDPNKLLKKLTNEIEKIENRLSNTEKLKNKLPFSDKLNNEHNLLKDFRELIYSGQWIGTKEEFEQAINNIKNNKVKITANINSKLGIGNPETKFNDIINKGQKVSRETKKIKNKLFSSIGDNIENSTKKEYLKSIEDYISYKIGDNEVETKAKDELTNYINKIIKGEILVESEKEFKIEIAKILKGGLTQNSLINKLNNAIRDDFSDTQKQKIKSLIVDIKNNPKVIITEEEINKIITDIELGNNINNIKIDYSKQVDLLKIEQEINSAKGIRKNDIFPEGANESKIKEDFDKIKAIIEFDEQGNNSFRTNELEKLKQSILSRKNNYTISQAIYVINEIQNGKQLKDININLAPETTDKIDDLISNKIRNLKNYFSGLNLNDKIKYLNENKEFYGNNFKKSILEEFVENTITEIESDTSLNNQEKVKKAEDLRRSIKNELDSGRIKSNLDKIIGLRGIAKLEKTVQGFEKEFKKGNLTKKRKERILDRLDEIYNDNLADDNLRTRIDDLKTDISDSMGMRNPSNSPEISQTDFEKMSESKKYSTIMNYYDRAILKAELKGDFETAQILDKKQFEFNNNYIKNNYKVESNFDFEGFKGDIKNKLQIDLNKNLDSFVDLNKKMKKVTKEIIKALQIKGQYSKAGDFIFKRDVRSLDPDIVTKILRKI